MEEGYGNEQPDNEAPEKKKKKKGGFHGRRGKRKFTRNARTGSEQKTSSVVRAPVNYESITTRTPTPCPAYAANKITKADISKTLRYERRDKSVSMKKSKRLENQLLINNKQHEKELEIIEANLAAKVVECNEVETLDQARRRGESKAMQMTDNKVVAMEDEMNKNIGAAKCEVESVSADAHTNVLE